MLPPGLTMVDSDSTDWSTDDFREHIAGKLQEHATVPPATRDSVVSALSFQPADVTQPEDVSRVIGADHPDTLVYLALPTTISQSPISPYSSHSRWKPSKMWLASVNLRSGSWRKWSIDTWP